MVAIRSVQAIGDRSADRSITAADSTGNPLDGATFKATMTPVEVHGATLLLLTAGHNQSAGTLTCRIVFYDKDGVFSGISDAIVLAANGSYTVTLKNASGNGNSRYPSAPGRSFNDGAHYARILVTSLTTSTSVDLYLESYDEEPNS